jgi:hypothetical protein
MQLKVLSIAGDPLRLAATGRVGLEPNGQRIKEDPFVALLGADVYKRKLLLCLEQAESCDSLGVAWLLGCHKRFREGGGMLILYTVPPLITSTLRVMHLDRMLHLAADEAAAEALAHNGAQP